MIYNQVIEELRAYVIIRTAYLKVGCWTTDIINIYKKICELFMPVFRSCIIAVQRMLQAYWQYEERYSIVDYTPVLFYEKFNFRLGC